MKSFKSLGSATAALLAVGVSAVPAMAQQSATLTFLETAGNVVGTWSGAFDTTGWSFLTNAPLSGRLQGPAAGAGFFGIAGSGTAPVYGLNVTYNSAASSGVESAVFTGPVIFASSNSGPVVAFARSAAGNPVTQIATPIAYTTGTALSSSSTWNSSTFASLGLGTGTYVWNYGANNSSITVQVGSTTGGGGGVPEPGEWAAMGILGAGLTGLVLRKRKKA